MSKLKQAFINFLKVNKNELIFILIHLIGCISIFCVFFNINNSTTYFIKLFKNSFSVILDISIVLITIILSFEFLIKQIYFNRISGRIIHGKIKKYVYQIFILIISILLLSIFNSNDIVLCTLFISFIFTFPLFFIWLMVDMENYDVNKYIKKRVKKIILKIEKNEDYQKELLYLSQIYLESASKNEVNICLQIVTSYNKFIVNFLYGKNKKLIKNQLTKENVSNLENDFLRFYTNSILPNDNFETKRINMIIIRHLTLLYENACKCEDEKLVNKIQTQFHFLFSFKLNNIMKDYFPSFIINFLGNPLEKKFEIL